MKEEGSGTKSEVLGIIANYHENYYGGWQVINQMLRLAGYTKAEYEAWLCHQQNAN